MRIVGSLRFEIIIFSLNSLIISYSSTASDVSRVTQNVR